MKKIIIGITAFILTLALVLVGAAQTIPSDYAISASQVIDAPKAVVFAPIINLRSWEQWSPWKQDDASMTFQFSENKEASTQGDWMAWDSTKNGPGKITVVSVETDNIFMYDMEMPSMTPVRCSLSLSDAENRTEITWSFRGSRTAMEKVLWRYTNIEADIQKKLNRGLANIKALAEKK